MPRETHILIYAAHRLNALAWEALVGGEPFLQVDRWTTDLETLRTWELRGSSSAMLVDLPAPSRSDAKTIRAGMPQIPALFLVDSYDLAIVFPLIQAGAGGCFSRSKGQAELASALTAVGRGELVLPGDVAREVLRTMAGEKPTLGGVVEPLTPREREVVGHLARGMTNKEIAQTLMISVRTVEAHLRNLYSKLEVSSRTEAALWAIRNGYGE